MSDTLHLCSHLTQYLVIIEILILAALMSKLLKRPLCVHLWINLTDDANKIVLISPA